MITRRQLLLLTCAGGLAALPDVLGTADAQSGHSVSRMLVGFGAGGAIDVIADACRWDEGLLVRLHRR